MEVVSYIACPRGNTIGSDTGITDSSNAGSGEHDDRVEKCPGSGEAHGDRLSTSVIVDWGEEEKPSNTGLDPGGFSEPILLASACSRAAMRALSVLIVKASSRIFCAATGGRAGGGRAMGTDSQRHKWVTLRETQREQG